MPSPPLCLVVGFVATSVAGRSGTVSRHDLSRPLATAQGFTACLPHDTHPTHSPRRRISCHRNPNEAPLRCTQLQRLTSGCYPPTPHMHGDHLQTRFKDCQMSTFGGRKAPQTGIVSSRPCVQSLVAPEGRSRDHSATRGVSRSTPAHRPTQK